MPRRGSRSAVRRPPSPAELQRALVVHALTRPATVVVGAALVVVAIALAAPWVLVIAVVAYATLAGLTLLDEDAQQRVGDRAYARVHGQLGFSGVDAAELSPAIRAQLDAACAEQAAIADTIEASGLGFADVREEVAGLVVALESAAARAQRLQSYLDTQDRRALSRRIAEVALAGDEGTAIALQAHEAELTRLAAMLHGAQDEMEQVTTALRTVHARLVATAVEQQLSGELDLVGDVRELRERVDLLTEGLPATPSS